MYILDVKLPVQLLQILVQRFQGDDTTLEIEGNFANMDARLLQDARSNEWPQSGGARHFDIPLTEENVKTLVGRILPNAGVRTKMHQIKISRNEKLLFYAEDNFMRWEGIEGRYNKGAGVTSYIETILLDDLVTKGILRRYTSHEPPSKAWA